MLNDLHTFVKNGRGAETAGAEEPAFSATDSRVDQVHDALQKIADGADRSELTNFRQDLKEYGSDGHVWLTWGGLNAGIQKILYRRGPETLGRVLKTVAEGRVVPRTRDDRRLELHLGSGRAILSLDNQDQKRTWVLTGWESGKPDVRGQVLSNPKTTQTGPIFGRSDLGAGLPRIIRALSGDANFAQRADPFYSAVARAVDAAKREEGTGAEWEATLKNMPGVKPEEMDWLGLKDWLAGRGRVTKAEVADYVAAHQVQLGETVYGKRSTQQPGLSMEQIDHISQQMGDELTANQSAMLADGGPDAARVLDRLEMEHSLNLEGIPRGSTEEDPNATRYASWATPGSDEGSYREMLMTLPQENRKPFLSGRDNGEYIALETLRQLNEPMTAEQTARLQKKLARCLLRRR